MSVSVGPEILSMRKAAEELSLRHGVAVDHRDVSFLVRVMQIPTHAMPSTPRGRGIDSDGLERLGRFLARPLSCGR